MNLKLPYPTKDLPWLSHIQLGLCQSVLARNYSPGCAFYTRSLNNYLELKNPLSTLDRLELSKLLLQLALTSGLDTHLLELFASVCTKLLKYTRFSFLSFI